MNLKRLEKRIIQSEGQVRDELGFHKPYLDHLGVPTIGYGATSIYGQRVTMKTAPLTDMEAKTLLRNDLFTAMNDASQFIEGFWFIGMVRREALVEMAYQLGGPKQRGFERAQLAGNGRNWSLMAAEMIDSLWHKQTTARCEEVAAMVKTNIHIWDIQ